MALHDRVAPKAIEIQEETEVQIVEPSMDGGIFDDDGEVTVAHGLQSQFCNPKLQLQLQPLLFLWMFHKLQMLVLKPL